VYGWAGGRGRRDALTALLCFAPLCALVLTNACAVADTDEELDFYQALQDAGQELTDEQRYRRRLLRDRVRRRRERSANQYVFFVLVV